MTYRDALYAIVIAILLGALWQSCQPTSEPDVDRAQMEGDPE